MPREYRIAERDDGLFDVVDIRTGEIEAVYEDEETASFMAEEMFCDDEVMIAHENQTARYNPALDAILGATFAIRETPQGTTILTGRRQEKEHDGFGD